MLDRVPPAYKIAAVAGVLLCGPVSVYSFIFWGVNVGIGVILGIVFFFLALYIIVVRKYG